MITCSSCSLPLGGDPPVNPQFQSVNWGSGGQTMPTWVIVKAVCIYCHYGKQRPKPLTNLLTLSPMDRKSLVLRGVSRDWASTAGVARRVNCIHDDTLTNTLYELEDDCLIESTRTDLGRSWKQVCD